MLFPCGRSRASLRALEQGFRGGWSGAERSYELETLELLGHRLKLAHEHDSGLAALSRRNGCQLKAEQSPEAQSIPGSAPTGRL